MPFPARRPDDATRDRARTRLGALAGPSPRPGGWTPDPEVAGPEPVTDGWASAEDAGPAAAAPQGGPAVGAAAPARWSLADRLAGVGPVRLDVNRRGLAAIAVVAAAAVVVALVLAWRARPHPVAVPPPIRTAAPTAAASPSPATVVVDVAGHVRHPGIVTLSAGARVVDAVQAAGGATDPGELTPLNLARRLTDGEQILVGVGPAPQAAGPATTGATAAGGAVDLNSATAAELDQLPGVGPVLAQRIVDWRTAHGRFTSVEQLREVDGIGDSKFAELRARVRV